MDEINQLRRMGLRAVSINHLLAVHKNWNGLIRRLHLPSSDPVASSQSRYVDRWRSDGMESFVFGDQLGVARSRRTIVSPAVDRLASYTVSHQ